MDRNIPHVRDIFSNLQKDPLSNNIEEVCVYDCSPASRRKKRDFAGIRSEILVEDSIEPTEDGNGRNKLEDYKLVNSRSKNKKNKPPTDENRVPSEHKKHNTNKNGNCACYGTKTLTEKDIRHLERHLSMKKTIRKQISRNLAQAFVEDPNAIQFDNPSSGTAAASQQSEKATNGSFTLTRAKVTKSEQNVLDMLRETRDDPQSGDSSPSNPSLCKEQHRHSRRKGAPPVNESASESKDNIASGDRFSFWKMFSIWGKGKH